MTRKRQPAAPPPPETDSFTEVWGGPEEWALHPCTACGFRSSSAFKDQHGSRICVGCYYGWTKPTDLVKGPN
jgi:hypothetical protein